VVADSGFTSRASVAASRHTRVPFILGFARSAPIRARPAALSGQQRRWLRDGGAIRLGSCPRDARLRLIAVGARSPTDRRGPWVYVTHLRSYGPQRLIACYRQRGRVEQTIDALRNGHDFDHLVSYRLHPNRVAVGFRLLARNLAIGLQLATATHEPCVIREPRAFRVAHVDGLGTFSVERQTILLRPLRTRSNQRLRLHWTRRVVCLAA
jgi:Transposase DDE domain